jgi:hypothetical protein
MEAVPGDEEIKGLLGEGPEIEALGDVGDGEAPVGSALADAGGDALMRARFVMIPARAWVGGIGGEQAIEEDSGAAAAVAVDHNKIRAAELGWEAELSPHGRERAVGGAEGGEAVIARASEDPLDPLIARDQDAIVGDKGGVVAASLRVTEVDGGDVAEAALGGEQAGLGALGDETNVDPPGVQAIGEAL